MEITIKNCNNIEEGIVNVTANKLNIKFGNNGIGKSTITKALKYKADTPDALMELLPFKHRVENGNVLPKVELNEDLNSVLIFNDEYLDQFLFKEDELISNSYEIFINTPQYRESTGLITNLLSEIYKFFSENEELEKTILDFERLSKSFSITRTGISRSSAFYRGLKDGNKIVHVPAELTGYSKLIKNENCVSWLDWQSKGGQYLDISNDCPYCTASTSETEEIIRSVSTHYDKNIVKNLIVIIDALANLGDYFTDNARAVLKDITEKQASLEEIDSQYIYGVKIQIDELLSKLKDLQSISAFSFQEDENIEEKLNNLKIDTIRVERLNSIKTKSIIDSLNNSLDEVLEKVGILKGEVNKQKDLVRKLVDKYKTEINSFLNNAGYKYQVEIENNASGNYRLLLKHTDSQNIINGGKQHLSFGEKNAFSIILFMYEALYKNPDLIILDDPISSFDKNKKYAIMHMLFRGDSNKCLLNKTVLMLTHDLDPVIDTVKVLREFGNLCEASFLSNKNGLLVEQSIKKQDLKTFTQICKDVLASDFEDLVKVIYLRRYYEIIDDLGNEYQVLSNLFHKRERDECTDNRKEEGINLISEIDFDDGNEGIKKMFEPFDYSTLLSKTKDESFLRSLYKNSQNGYEKLNLFRLIYSESLDEVSGVLRKYINETYHIENELICQLSPKEYDLVPEFIIQACDQLVSAD